MKCSAPGSHPQPNPSLGLAEYFAPGDIERVHRVTRELRELKVKHLRVFLPCSDWQQHPDWPARILKELSSHFELLPVFCFVAPTIDRHEMHKIDCCSPADLALFAQSLLESHGDCFEWFELGNPLDDGRIWDWSNEEDWQRFSALSECAFALATSHAKNQLLAGLRPGESEILERLCHDRLIDKVAAVGLSGYPDSWDFEWRRWSSAIRQLSQNLQHTEIELWISETGYSTWRHDEVTQAWRLAEALQANVTRVYWSGTEDLQRPEKHCPRTDERCYHFGLKDRQGRDKFALRIWKQRGLDGLIALSQKLMGDAATHGEMLLKANAALPATRQEQFGLAVRPQRTPDAPILITGGAGFIGSNLARRLASQGQRVAIFDSLQRPGVERNLESLLETFGDHVDVILADVRNLADVRKAVRNARQVYHFAAQVAVTTSLEEPTEDFAVNLSGTLNVLESLREMDTPPPLVFTSTNKVYGALDDLPLRKGADGYEPDSDFFVRGISEQQALDFHSPYGCSKGAADQYVLDYARSYGLPAAVFRMSCVYGPQQFGTEDQGWVAHFLIQCLQGKPLTVYGDGHQVRDLLYVDDLLDALELAQSEMDHLAGRAFNIGGGANNSSSLLNVIKRIENITGRSCPYDLADWRLGDQRYYVSNTQLFEQLTGWRANTDIDTGLRQLYQWLSEAASTKPPLAHYLSPEGGSRHGGTIN